MMFAFTTSASAQSSYSFSLDKEVVQVYWNADGTEALDYQLTFTNDPSGHPIDYVDMGMPNGNFDMNTVKADVAGQAVDISTSDYQGTGSGFAVVMGSQTIPSGGSGTVHVSVGSITGVLYQDTSIENGCQRRFLPALFRLPIRARQHGYDRNIPSPAGRPTAGTALPHHPGRLAVRRSSPRPPWIARTALPTPGNAPAPMAPRNIPSELPSRATTFRRAPSWCRPPFDISGILDWFGSNGSTFCCFGFFILMFVGIPILSAIQQQETQTRLPAAQDPDRRPRHQARPDGGRSCHPDGTAARQGHDHDPVRRGQEECRHGGDA